jgi:4-hydroxy-tetrahydrodipicolinate synthase
MLDFTRHMSIFSHHIFLNMSHSKGGEMITGSFTALVTPFDENGVDEHGLEQLSTFQIENGITGILAAGTTGESPTLSWEEHHKVIKNVALACRGRCLCIAGTGSNNTSEALMAARQAAEIGVDAILMVDPYYNGPSSLEIRREYIAPVAAALPDIQIIPYIIPGRTGAQMLPEDLALLAEAYPNVRTVKEATGDLDNMRRTRECCGDGYTIMSGDDSLTFEMMTDPAINAAGVISVASNVAPKAISEMVALLAAGETNAAERLRRALEPLFGLVTIKTTESTPHGQVVCRARNPLGIKTLMAGLGMPSGHCRRPLGKMTRAGLDVVISAAKTVQEQTPEIFEPAAAFFNIDMDAKINDPANWADLCYPDY